MVGSSNLSRSALQTGVEWNLISEQQFAPETHEQVRREFSLLWDQGSELTSELLKGYAEKAKTLRSKLFVPDQVDSQEEGLHRAHGKSRLSPHSSRFVMQATRVRWSQSRPEWGRRGLRPSMRGRLETDSGIGHASL